MLGRLEMSVDECIVANSDLTETVFGQKLSRIPVESQRQSQGAIRLCAAWKRDQQYYSTMQCI